jgi:hypothetical protein
MAQHPDTTTSDLRRERASEAKKGSSDGRLRLSGINPNDEPDGHFDGLRIVSSIAFHS